MSNAVSMMVLVKMIQLKMNTSRYSQIDKKESVVNEVACYAAYINNNEFFFSLFLIITYFFIHIINITSFMINFLNKFMEHA